MIAKICDCCGRTYEPYGTVIDQEEDLDQNEENLNEETLEDEDADYEVLEEAPEINGMMYTTIDAYGTKQYSHEMRDLCETCRDMHLALDTAIQEHPTPTKITGIDTLTFTVESDES